MNASYFDPLNRTNGLGHRFSRINADELDADKIDKFTGLEQLLVGPVLSPVFDEIHFSLRVNPTESKNWEGILETSTRDFLLNTYHWSCLISTKSIRRIRIKT